MGLWLMLRPLLGRTGALLGSADSEAPAHVHWLAAGLAGLWQHGPLVLSASPRGTDPTDALMDPANLLFIAPISGLRGGGLEGFAAGWNTLPVVGMLLSAVGAWIWARAWLGDRDPRVWGAGLAAGLAACSLWALQQIEVGRSECFLYPAFALHGGLLFSAIRRGGRYRWLGAGASMALLVGCGLSTLPLLLLGQAAVFVWARWGAPERTRPWLGLASLVGVGAALCLPLYLAMIRHPPPSMDHLEGRVSGPSVRLEQLLWGSGDMLAGLPGYEVSPWLGWALVLGVALAALSWRPARLPALLLVALLTVCAGPNPTLLGAVLVGPSALLEALPGPVGLVRGWVRLAGMLVPMAAVIAAAAVVRRPWLAGMLLLLGLGEAVWRSPPARSTLSLAPPERAALLEAQGVRWLELPRDRIALARRSLLGPAEPDAWDPQLDNDLMVLLDGRVSNLPKQFDRQQVPEFTPDELRDLRRRVAKLHKHGLHGVLLRDHSLVPDTAERAGQLLDAIACPPGGDSPGFWALPPGEHEPCGSRTAPREPTRTRRSLGEPI